MTDTPGPDNPATSSTSTSTTPTSTSTTSTTASPTSSTPATSTPTPSTTPSSTTSTPTTPGTDRPDARGRTGLHLTGRDLTGNPRVRVTDVRLLASNWHVLRSTTLEYLGADGTWSTQQRETYDRGDGATILLYDPARRTVLLTRQFRYPVYVNGHPDGMLVETAAGLLDDDEPEAAIRREAAEETGLDVGEVEPVFVAYMSPGSVTEKIHFFAAPYHATPATLSAGLVDEGEEIELVELAIADAVADIGLGITDAKTIMLLQWAVLSGPFAPVGG